MTKRPKNSRGQDPVLRRIRETNFEIVDAVMRDTPPTKDELDAAMDGATARARERAMPLEQRKKLHHEQRADHSEPAPDVDALDAFIDGLTPEQRDQIHERLLAHAIQDDSWNTDFEDDESYEDETGEEL